ncbi:MAG: type II secretion system GspH family protein [Verrucomicrobiota bacterium]|nr:type II secretion system GspH family protein [Verrucomicrobiota bacterium]
MLGRRDVLGRAGDTPATTFGFTVIELLVVMAIILVLAGLILATSSYVHNKGARSRAEAEIAAMSAALENYKADNGVYPRGVDSDGLNAKTDGNPASPIPNTYTRSSFYLYGQLSGDTDGDRVSNGGTTYFSFKDNQLSPSSGTVQFIKDPFGNSYGYSTAGQSGGAAGYNPTFDLWSTANSTLDPTQPNDVITPRWIKNW